MKRFHSTLNAIYDYFSFLHDKGKPDRYFDFLIFTLEFLLNFEYEGMRNNACDGLPFPSSPSSKFTGSRILKKSLTSLQN